MSLVAWPPPPEPATRPHLPVFCSQKEPPDFCCRLAEPGFQGALDAFVVLQLAEHFRQAERDAHRFLPVALDEEALEHLTGAARIAARLEEPGQRLERASVHGIALQHGLVGLDGLAHVAEARFVNFAEPHGEGQRGLGVLAFLGEVDLRAQQIGEVLIAPRLLVELREQQYRVLVPRILVEHAAERFDGVVARGNGLQARQLEAQLGPLAGGRRYVDETREKAPELAVLIVLGVELAQRRGGLGVGGVVLDDRFVELDGGRCIAALLIGDIRRGVLQLGDLEAIRGELGPAEQQLEHLVEGGGRLAQARQLFERPEVGFVLVEELAQHFFGEGRVPHVLLGEDLGLAEELSFGGRVQLELGEPPQALHQVTLAAGGSADALDGA